MPYLDLFNMRELNVALIGSSSHFLTKPETMLSKSSITHVLIIKIIIIIMIYMFIQGKYLISKGKYCYQQSKGPVN